MSTFDDIMSKPAYTDMGASGSTVGEFLDTLFNSFKYSLLRNEKKKYIIPGQELSSFNSVAKAFRTRTDLICDRFTQPIMTPL